MITTIVSHEVKDFTEWKKGFDAEESNRSQLGLKFMGLFTDVSNQNHVTIIFEMPSVEVFEGMMSNPEFHETMKKAGVISKPEVKVLNRV